MHFGEWNIDKCEPDEWRGVFYEVCEERNIKEMAKMREEEHQK
jgi:hypothetical protein